MDFPHIIELLAELAAKHKLIPFLGAGCSKPHLSQDWTSLVAELASATQVDASIGNLEVAQRYVEEFGRAALVDFLKQRLTVLDYEDARGDVHLGVMSMGLGVVYTTNQDNVFETCGVKYGRLWRSIVNIGDLAEARPGEHFYYKYHGDLLSPDSIIFTTNDYEQRVRETSHFLNIRLRSDLLAKSLLFLGYSFQDDTIREVQLSVKVCRHLFWSRTCLLKHWRTFARTTVWNLWTQLPPSKTSTKRPRPFSDSLTCL